MRLGHAASATCPSCPVTIKDDKAEPSTTPAPGAQPATGRPSAESRLLFGLFEALVAFTVVAQREDLEEALNVMKAALNNINCEDLLTQQGKFLSYPADGIIISAKQLREWRRGMSCYVDRDKGGVWNHAEEIIDEIGVLLSGTH